MPLWISRQPRAPDLVCPKHRMKQPQNQQLKTPHLQTNWAQALKPLAKIRGILPKPTGNPWLLRLSQCWPTSIQPHRSQQTNKLRITSARLSLTQKLNAIQPRLQCWLLSGATANLQTAGLLSTLQAAVALTQQLQPPHLPQHLPQAPTWFMAPMVPSTHLLLPLKPQALQTGQPLTQ